MTGPFLVGVGSFTVIVLLQRFSRLADLVIAKGCRRRSSGASSLPSQFFEITLPPPCSSWSCSAWGGSPQTRGGGALRRRGDARGCPPVLAASVVTCAAVLLTGWQGSPGVPRDAAHPRRDRLRARRRRRLEHVFREITPGLVYPDRVSPDGQRMSGVFLSFRPAGDDPLLVFAREGRFVPAAGDFGGGPGLSDGTIHTASRQGRLSLYRVAPPSAG